jgi:ribonuclease P protein component
MLVVHLADAAPTDDAAGAQTPPAQVGFVVSRSVGGSVVRSRVSRRLRHVMRSRLDSIPEGALVVVRASSPAATASSAALAAEIDRALARLLPRSRTTA